MSLLKRKNLDEIVISSNLNINWQILLSCSLIILTQLFLSSFIAFHILNFNVPTILQPFFAFTKPLFGIIIFIFSFIFLQGITAQIFLRTMRQSTTRHVLMGTCYISSYYLIPLIPVSEFNVFFIRLFGAKIGKNVMITMGSKFIDAYLIEVKGNTQFGAYVLVSGHTTEKGKTILKKVKIGKNVLIGAKTYINPGVTIGDNSIIATCALLPKNRAVPANTVWGGIPAKKIGKC